MKKYKKVKMSDIKTPQYIFTATMRKKGNRVEVEGIVKGLVNYYGMLRQGYSGFLVDNKETFPIFGTCDASAKATIKASMLKYSEDTDTPVTIRGIIKKTDYITERANEQKIGYPVGYILKVKAVAIKKYQSILWKWTKSE